MKKIFFIAVVLLIGVAGYLYFFSSNPPTRPSPDPQTLRTTESGPVIGYHDSHNTHAWRGIPYADSTAGLNRFRSPQPPRHWDKPLQALEYRDICPQFWSIAAGMDGKEGQLVGSEDCLYLNIWAPAMNAATAVKKKLPVMVWIHGGANSVGTANTYPGYHLASSQQVVLVTINYRLSTLGWFNHPALTETAGNPEDASGNFGTLDIIQALKWVKENIAAFGGDPGNVTVFGESAGGHNTYALLLSPLARGLFHKAIVSSGFASTDPLFRARNYIDDPQPGHKFSSNEILIRLLLKDGKATDRDSAKKVIAGMGAKKIVTYLRSKSLAELYSIYDSKMLGGVFLTPHHIRDGYVIPAEPALQLFRDPAKYNAVPLIVGTNRDEGKLAIMLDPDIVGMRFGVLPVVKDKAEHQRMAAYMSDTWKALSVDEPAAVLHKSQGDTIYTYRFEWDDWPFRWLAWLVDLRELFGAIHGLDVGFVFGDVEGIVGMSITHSDDNKAGRLALQHAMMNYWGNFAWTGSPGKGRDGKQPLWTPWQPDGKALMILDDPAQGGLQMSPLRITARDLKQRILSDKAIKDEKSLCQLYARVFLTSHHIDDFFDQQEYEQLGKKGCAEYDPWSFYTDNF